MEFDDLIKLPIAAVFFCIPLLAIYYTLKILNWNQGEKLFSNSWLIYILWWFSALLVFVFTANLMQPLIFGIALFVAGTFNVATALLIKSRMKNSLSILSSEEKKTEFPDNRKIWKTAASVNIAVILTVGALICVGACIADLFEKPALEQKTGFAMYD